MFILPFMIEQLDDDYGVDGDTYNQILEYVIDNYGAAAGITLSAAVDATDDRFYIAEGTCDRLVDDIENVHMNSK
jgi:hypothetical protein